MLFSGSGNRGISPAVASFVKPPYVGSVWFTGSKYYIHVNGSVSGFQPGTQHGVHVHQYGGLGNNCNDAGPHWNLYNRNHGGPNTTVRHEGDLGNGVVDARGNLQIDVYVNPRDICRYNGFLGRALVIHQNQDDLGTRPTPESKSTGSSGPRLACATIGYRGV
ncbi:unnamed protein product [Trichobilharzia regenti]|nr:unnamed protein product [Trichobilharzia regenti]